MSVLLKDSSVVDVSWPGRPDTGVRFLRITVARLVIVLGLSVLLTVGLCDFHTRGEAREALVVQSIVQSSDWVLPRGYNEAVPSKPPLFHWIAASLSLLTGEVNERSVRLPSALFSLFTLVFFVYALRSDLSEREKLLFSAILFLSFGWLHSTVSARVDMVHAATLSSGVLAGFLAFRSGRWAWVLAAAGLCGLAVLSKGPVGIALPGLVLAGWLVLRREVTPRALVTIGVLLVGALALSFPWYVAAYLRAPEQVSARFWYENVARFTSTMEDSPHRHSAVYLLKMLFLETLPWSPLAILTFWGNSRVGPGEKRSLTPSRYELRSFCTTAACTIIAFYMIPSSKRGVYLLPAYPFLALLLVFALRSVPLAVVRESRVWKFAGVSFALFLAIQLVVGPFILTPRKSEKDLGRVLSVESERSGKIYSYGYEFYGASFYSRRRFYRLEDLLSVGEARVLEPDDILVVKFFDWIGLQSREGFSPRGLEVIESMEINGDSVLVLRSATALTVPALDTSGA